MATGVAAAAVPRAAAATDLSPVNRSNLLSRTLSTTRKVAPSGPSGCFAFHSAICELLVVGTLFESQQTRLMPAVPPVQSIRSARSGPDGRSDRRSQHRAARRNPARPRLRCDPAPHYDCASSPSFGPWRRFPRCCVGASFSRGPITFLSGDRKRHCRGHPRLAPSRTDVRTSTPSCIGPQDDWLIRASVLREGSWRGSGSKDLPRLAG